MPGLTASALIAGLAELEGTAPGSADSDPDTMVRAGGLAEAYLAGAAAAANGVEADTDRDPRSALARTDADAVDPKLAALDPKLLAVLVNVPAAARHEPTPIFDQLVAEVATGEVITGKASASYQEATVSWGIMPVRDTAEDPIADDYIVWSDNVDAPLFRGTREQLTAWWRRYERTKTTDSHFDALFERADAKGSSHHRLCDWGKTTSAMEVPGGPGVLRRDQLRAFAALAFPGYPRTNEGHGVAPDHTDANAERIAALLEPFEDAEAANDHESTGVDHE
jgi:hypothetical protein